MTGKINNIRYHCVIEYDGTPYCGWQKQQDSPSVQEALEKAIANIVTMQGEVIGAGRTDTGVHATGQSCHFDCVKKPISTVSLAKAINWHLSNAKESVRVITVSEANHDFHARFSAVARTYEYHILNRTASSPLNNLRVWHVRKPLDLASMLKAANYLIGTHDFTSFRSVHCVATKVVKSISSITITKNNDNLIITISAPSFLMRQVRIIVGSLVSVGINKNTPDWMHSVLQAKDRTKADVTAPAHGLYLTKVSYN